MKTSTEAIERDFDVDDDLDGDETLAVTPPDVVTVLGFDPLDESEGELPNEQPERLTLAELAALRADPANHHHLRLTYDCGHTDTCRCMAPKTAYRVEGPCRACEQKANEGPGTGQPCGESHISGDKVCHVGEVSPSKVVATKAAAVETMAGLALNNPFMSARAREMTAADKYPVEKIKRNWSKFFNDPANTNDGVKAFDNIRPELVETVKAAGKANAENPNFKPFLEQYGPMPVVVRQLEKSNWASACYQGGVIHVFESPLQDLKPTGSLELGSGTIGKGAMDSILRHEYGHGVRDSKPPSEATQEWASFWASNREKFKSEISIYSGSKNENEGFAESFSAFTHRDYDRTKATPFVRDVEDKFWKVIRT